MGDRFGPLFRKIPWRRAWQPNLVFCLENPMDRIAWQATVHGAQRARHDWVPNTTHRWLSVLHMVVCTCQCHFLNSSCPLHPPSSFLKQLGCSVNALDSITTCRMYWSSVQNVARTPPPRGHGRKSGKREGFLLTYAEGRAVCFQSEVCFF